MTDTETQPTPGELIEAVAARLGLTMRAGFIPFSQSRNAKPRDGKGEPWRSLNWRIKLSLNGKDFLTTEYSAGEGHAPAAKRPAAWFKRGPYSPQRNRARLIAWEIENGYPGTWPTIPGSNPQPIRAAKATVIQPELADVLSSLVMDAGVLDSGGFECWAEDFGYDTDSRQAEATYKACLEIALKMRTAIGDEGLQALRDAAQDY